MVQVRELNVQYIIDDKGQRTGVILPIEEFEELLEDLDDLAVAAARRDEPTTSHKDFLNELRSDGLLPD